MKVSAITSLSSDEVQRRNAFIRYSNNFMSAPEVEEPQGKAFAANKKSRNEKMGIENLEEFTIFPKEVVDGRTVITA